MGYLSRHFATIQITIINGVYRRRNKLFSEIVRLFGNNWSETCAYVGPTWNLIWFASIWFDSRVFVNDRASACVRACSASYLSSASGCPCGPARSCRRRARLGCGRSRSAVLASPPSDTGHRSSGRRRAARRPSTSAGAASLPPRPRPPAARWRPSPSDAAGPDPPRSSESSASTYRRRRRRGQRELSAWNGRVNVEPPRRVDAVRSNWKFTYSAR